MDQKLVTTNPYMKIVVEKLEACASVLDDLTDIYKSKFLADVQIKTKSNSFLAHKIVLCARSPVFKCMFSNDMREKNSDCIQVDDLEDETVQQLLDFLYSDKVENLVFEDALALYYAADKYDIRKLKLICSSFLVENLTTSTVIELLNLADTCNDSDLVEIVEHFIWSHEKQVFCSKKWEELMKGNPQLALKTMHSKYKTKKKHLFESDRSREDEVEKKRFLSFKPEDVSKMENNKTGRELLNDDILNFSDLLDKMASIGDEDNEAAIVTEPDTSDTKSMIIKDYAPWRDSRRYQDEDNQNEGNVNNPRTFSEFLSFARNATFSGKSASQNVKQRENPKQEERTDIHRLKLHESLFLPRG